MPQPILIITTSVDKASDKVIQIINDQNIPTVRINTEEYPFHKSTSYEVSNSLGSPRFSIDGKSNYRSIWYRRMRSSPKPNSMDPGHYDFSLKEARYALLGSILGISTEIPIMSSPQAVWAAEQKPYQLAVAKICGLKIPETLISNMPERVKIVYDKFNREMIVKPVRTGYIETSGKPMAIYTSKLSEEHIKNLEQVSITPSIFQPLIKKISDIRVTIVGEKVFTAEIDSQSEEAASIDWRKTENPNIPHSMHVLPHDIENKLLYLMKKLALSFGAIDLILNENGEYIFLEVNPGGQWLWLERILNFSISEEIANWLINEK